MRTKYLLVLSILLGVLGLGLMVGRAHADVLDAGPDAPLVLDAGVLDAAVEVGSGSGSSASGSDVIVTTTTTTVLPGNLHNPVDNPVAAVDDAKQAKKQGWPLFLLTIAVMITAAFSRATEHWPDQPVLKTFTKNKTLIFIIAAMSAIGSAAYNALAEGGSGYAVLVAAAGAALLFIAPKPKAVTAS